jgi:hypothetical protein
MAMTKAEMMAWVEAQLARRPDCERRSRCD